MKRIILAVLAVALSYTAAFALSAEQAKMRNDMEYGNSQVNAYNAQYAMVIKYVGVSTQAAIAVTTYTMTSEAPLGTFDSKFGGSTGLRYDTYATFGALCDKINAISGYSCALKDSKRDDAFGLLEYLASSASTDAKASGGYSVPMSTGGITTSAPFFDRLGIQPYPGKRVILKSCHTYNNATGTFLVYGTTLKNWWIGGLASLADTTLVYTYPTASNTLLSTDFTTSGIGGIEFAPDAHVLISAGNVASVQTTGDYVQCAWTEK